MTLPGGPANKAGNRYERLWTVDQLLRLIDGRSDSIRIEVPRAEKAEFVVCRGELREWHQAKRNSPRGNWSVATLSAEGVIEAMRTFLGVGDSRFVFVSGSSAPELAGLCEAANGAESVQEFESAFLEAQVRREAFDRLRAEWRCDAATAVAYLQRIEVRTIGDRELEEKVAHFARALFLADPLKVVRELEAVPDDSVHRRIRREELVERLRRVGIVPRQVKGREQAALAVRQVTEAYLGPARHKLIRGELLSRPVSTEVLGCVGNSVTAVVGKAGSGKTACAVAVVEGLLTRDLQVLAFRLDPFVSAADTADLGRRLGLEESPVLMLGAAAEERGTTGVMVVDQLDAVSTMSGRRSEALDLVENLLREVEAMRARSEIHVIVVCRKFDWTNDHRLRQLTRDGGTEVTVDELTEDETRKVLGQGGYRSMLFHERQLKLLRTPQNLSLFLEAGFEPGTVPAFDTVTELLDRYWDHKRRCVEVRVGATSDQWKDVLRLLCEHMAARQELSARREVVDGVPLAYLDQMVSEGVLSSDDGKWYAFGHESFFDYCYARVSFLPGSTSLQSMLASSEQHLFRRGQVRQVLTYVRDADFERYVAEVGGLLAAADVRVHIKDLVFALLADVHDPREREWDLWKEWAWPAVEALKGGVTNDDKVSALAWRRFFQSESWFEFLRARGVVGSWLDSGVDGLVETAFRYLAIHHRHAPDGVAALLEPYADLGGDWRRRMAAFAVWADVGSSRRLFELFLRLIDNGSLDEARGLAVNSTFWHTVHGLDEERPAWVGEVLVHRLRRRLAILKDAGRDVGRGRVLDADQGSAAAMFMTAAEGAPGAFVRAVLPVVLEISDSTAWGDELPLPDGVWPFLVRSAHPDAEEGCLEALTEAVGGLAREAGDGGAAEANELRSRSTHVANHLLLALYRGAPARWAEEMVDLVCAEPWRFACGYSSNGNWCAMETITAVAPHCTRETLERLEAAILGYKSRVEAGIGGRADRGSASFALLSAVPERLRSERAQRRYQELERKFGKPPGEPQPMRAQFVPSPIAPPQLAKMTDDQWLRAIKKYATHDSFLMRGGEILGGAHQLSQALGACVAEEPSRFARLALRFEADMNPAYMQAVLRALAGVDLARESKLAVCRKAYRESAWSCGAEIADAVGSVSGGLPDDALKMIEWLATEHPDPEGDQRRQTGSAGGGEPGELDERGINSVRGRAAVAIQRLILSDPDHLARLRGTVDRMLADKSAGVLSCVAGALEAIAHTDSGAAVAMFLRMRMPTDTLLASYGMVEFLRFALVDRFPELRPFVARMNRSDVPEVGESGAALACLAVLHGHGDAEQLVDEALCSGEPLRLGVAKVAADNVNVRGCRDWCEAKLAVLFDDDNAAVRRKAALCVQQLRGEPIEEYENLVDAFTASAAFGDDSSSMLGVLKDSRQRLPGMVCVVCERFLDRFAVEARDMASSRSGDVYTLASLVFRTYQQHQADPWGSRALDLIDRLCLEGLGAADAQFESFER